LHIPVKKIKSGAQKTEKGDVLQLEKEDIFVRKPSLNRESSRNPISRKNLQPALRIYQSLAVP
jgi:hypothetical protein